MPANKEGFITEVQNMVSTFVHDIYRPISKNYSEEVTKKILEVVAQNSDDMENLLKSYKVKPHHIDNIVSLKELIHNPEKHDLQQEVADSIVSYNHSNPDNKIEMDSSIKEMIDQTAKNTFVIALKKHGIKAISENREMSLKQSRVDDETQSVGSYISSSIPSAPPSSVPSNPVTPNDSGDEFDINAIDPGNINKQQVEKGIREIKKMKINEKIMEESLARQGMLSAEIEERSTLKEQFFRSSPGSAIYNAKAAPTKPKDHDDEHKR